MSTGDFQTRYASVMESMLKSAAAETTTLFETMVDELKAEISRIKKENEDLRARCSQFEERPSTVCSRESPAPPQPCSEKRDTAVQCDLVPLRTVLVEQCQSLENSSLQIEQQRCCQWEMENSLQDHNYGNADSQMTLVKEEESYDDSSLLPVIKQEDDVPDVVCDKVTNEERATACRNGNEGPLIDHICSTGEMFENDEETRVTLEPRCPGMDNDLERAQNQPSEPEHPLVLTRGCSSDREKTSGFQQCSMEMEAPPTENSSATETFNSPPAESPQASPVELRERCSSVTLQDAMLLVEAMNRSAGENLLSSFKGMRESPQTQDVPYMDSLQTMDKVPAEPQTLSSETCDAGGSPAITLLSTTQSTVQTLSTSPRVTESHSTNKAKPQIKIIIQNPLVTAPNFATQQLPSSTCETQTGEQSQQQFPRPVIRWVITSKPSKANPNNIIVLQRPESLLMPYQFAALPPTQSPTLVSTFVAAQNNSLLSSSTERPSFSLLPKKTMYEASRKSVPVVPLPLPATSTDKQSGFLPHTKCPRQVSVVTSGTHQSPLEQKLSAVVKLSRLPISVSTKEPVLVSRLLSYGFHERPSEMHVTSQNICPNLKETADSVSFNTSQFSRENNKNQDMYHSESVPPPTPPKVSASVFDISRESLSKPSAVEPISNSEKEICSNAMQGCARSNDAPTAEEGSANLIQLISIPPKEGSHPHLQMSQTQFLAQLAVLPVVQAPQTASVNDVADTAAPSAETSTKGRKRLEKNTLMSRLRSHLKTHLPTRRSKTKMILQNDIPNKTNTATEHIPVKPKESGFVEDVASLNKAVNYSIPKSPKTGLCRDPRPKRSVSEPTRTSEPNSETTPKRGRRSSSRKVSVCSKNVKCSSVTHGRPSSTKDGANPKQTEGGVSLKNTKPTTRRISSSKGSATLKQTKSSSVSAKRSPSTRQQSSLKETESSAASPLKSNLSVNVAKFTVTQTSSSMRQFKRESSPLSLCRKTTDIAGTKRQSGSSSVCCPKLAKGGVSPGKTVETTPAKKARLIQKVKKPKKNLSGLNANNFAKAAKATKSAKIKTSKKSKLQNAFKTSLLTQKTHKTQAVWIPPTIQASETPVIKHQCGECGRILSSSAALESHVGLHTGSRPFSCTLCEKSFPDAKGLSRHEMVHSNGKVHICKLCGKGFGYSFSLTKHVQMVHHKIKPFVCQTCNKSFFIKQQMEDHIRTHTGEKPFECNLCERRFARKVKLDVHLRWHNGEKRHCCSFCGKRFLDANNLKRHKFIHTGEKPHSCPHCPKHFTQSGHLKKHVKNLHKVT